MKKFRYDDMNKFTYDYNQFPDDTGRILLRNMIAETAPYENKIATTLAASDCYRITAIENVLFNGKSRVNIDQLSHFVYAQGFFIWSREYPTYPGSFQNDSTKNIYNAMLKHDLIKSYDYTDCDYGKSVEGRLNCFEKLTNRMKECSFNSARVCFTNGSNYGHAIMVCNNDNGKPVVIDNSNRPHEYPDNNMFNFITSQNILWWTEIK